MTLCQLCRRGFFLLHRNFRSLQITKLNMVRRETAGGGRGGGVTNRLPSRSGEWHFRTLDDVCTGLLGERAWRCEIGKRRRFVG